MTFLLSVMILTGIESGAVIANNENSDDTVPTPTEWSNTLRLGDYFTLGKYNDAPILWRYVADDENGKLIVSDKILCFKPFGKENVWETSWIRNWLNSSVADGEVNWDWGAQYSFWMRDNIDVYEKGFLHESNFTAIEKLAMKPVTQWTMLPQEYVSLSTNGYTEAYNPLKEYRKGSPRDGGYFKYYEVSELSEAYYGAAYELTDTVFLLDELQIYHIWENFGDVKAVRAEACEKYPTRYTGDNYHFEYFLRTPALDENYNCAYITLDGIYGSYNRVFEGGIRPAFYLNEEEAMIMSGSGTAEDPYVMSGKEIRVTVNEKEMQLDQPAMIKDGIVLVPLRSIFEALGAEIIWDEESQTVTATKGEEKIKVQIGSSILNKNGTEIDLGYPALLEGERTMVPLNAIEEGLGVTAAWNGDALQVTITG